MDDLDALHAAILRTPDDDVLRLAYADCLDERGQPERAEFIRVQVELAKMPYMGTRQNDPRYMLPAPWEELRRRERELFRGSGPKWWNDLPGSYRATVERTMGIETAEGWWYTVTRGFVSRAKLSASGFLAHAGAIFRAHPVTQVVLSDAGPWENDGVDPSHWRWQAAGRGEPAYPMGDVPDAILKHVRRHRDFAKVDIAAGKVARCVMKTFPTREAALTALGDGCVAYARVLAGLPPLAANAPSITPVRSAPTG